jgi:hypothetical protein
MNRRNLFESSLALSVIAILFVLPFAFRYWPSIGWAVIGIVGVVIGAVIANVIYAFVWLELGYSTHAEQVKRQHREHGLRHLLHPGMLRHR